MVKFQHYYNRFGYMKEEFNIFKIMNIQSTHVNFIYYRF